MVVFARLYFFLSYKQAYLSDYFYIQAILKQCKHEMEQMLLNCYRIMSIGLKKITVCIIYILVFGFIGCTVSLVNARVPFIILAGLSQYLTVLSQVVNYCSICDSSVNKHINTSDDNFYIDNGTSLSSSLSSSVIVFSSSKSGRRKTFLDGGSLGLPESTM